MITGFPSPAQGYEDGTLDLNALLIKHPASTVMMRIDTQRYSNVGIYSGDLLIVDRSVESFDSAQFSGDECILVYEHEGEFKISRKSSLLNFFRSRVGCAENSAVRGRSLCSVPEGTSIGGEPSSYGDLFLEQLHVFGIVSAIIHSTTGFM